MRRKAGRSGWGQDPSRIIELTNAYAFARENGLPMPPGLIAHRPANKSADASKVGTFKFIAESQSGREPQILVVMSVEEQQTAEIIMAGRGRRGLNWRFVTATLSDNRLEYVPREAGPRFIFDWSDANSGSVGQISNVSGVGNRSSAASSSRFSRLDG